MSDTENELGETGRKRQDFQDTTRATFEESERYIQASRDKTERLPRMDARSSD